MFPLKRSNKIVKTKKPVFAEAHTANTKVGSGDYYGSGFKNPVGKVRGSDAVGLRPVTRKQLGTKPRTLA